MRGQNKHVDVTRVGGGFVVQWEGPTNTEEQWDSGTEVFQFWTQVVGFMTRFMSDNNEREDNGEETGNRAQQPAEEESSDEEGRIDG